MTREIIGFKIESKDDTIRISQEDNVGDENFIVITVDQVDNFCQLLKKERDNLKRQK